MEVCGIVFRSLCLLICQAEHVPGKITVPGVLHRIFIVVYGTAFPGFFIRFLIFCDFHGIGEYAVRIVTQYLFQLFKVYLPVVLLGGAELGDDQCAFIDDAV